MKPQVRAGRRARLSVTLYYERLLATSDRTAVENEAKGKLATLQSPRDFVRDPVMLEFLGLPGVGRLLEADLERALLDNLQAFLLELGRGFAFVARQCRISSESKDFYVDLVFTAICSSASCCSISSLVS
jgi:predicted nuclease of restriction endonuclease-like (RecB) superfamily